MGLVVLLLLASYGFYFGVTEVGVQQGYRPEQPIKYSHKIHAGELQIDCKYCHSAARQSKNSGIPSLNVCMNCHKNIAEYNGEEDLGDDGVLHRDLQLSSSQHHPPPSKYMIQTEAGDGSDDEKLMVVMLFAF